MFLYKLMFAWEHVYTSGEYKLLCEYMQNQEKVLKNFADKYLISHMFFEKQLDIGENRHFLYLTCLSIKVILIGF